MRQDYPPFATVQAVLGSDDRAQALARLWEKQRNGSQPDAQVLLAAAVLMTGKDQPSPAAALSAAQGLAGRPAGDGLVALVQALAAFDHTRPLSPVYANLVAAALQAVAVRLSQQAVQLRSTHSDQSKE